MFKLEYAEAIVQSITIMPPKRVRRRPASSSTSSAVSTSSVTPGQPPAVVDAPVAPYQSSHLIIKDTLHKGKGVFSSTSILQGTCIIAEQPILTFPADIRSPNQITSIVEGCSEEARRKFLAFGFAEVHAKFDPFLRIVKTNCVPMASRNQAGLFETICHVNHDCRPNALYCWDEALGKEVLHALVDIPAGEEITVSYYPVLDGPERCETLRSTFGFTCQCPSCSIPPTELAQSDRRAAELPRIIDDVAILIRTNPTSAIAKIHQAIGIIEREKNYGRLPSQFFDAFQTCAAWRDLPNAKV
ncbi:hypothetical protein FRB94_002928 [Tulasnella sp. JGI-2019a]|nr:hypothetical protein FRB93_013947 [Tulasnella sp. JGI-2019a]KAG9013400.1 hypothetical protein FRB94_002928 [Tulasnella sp. JGI-2019a]